MIPLSTELLKSISNYLIKSKPFQEQYILYNKKCSFNLQSFSEQLFTAESHLQGVLSLGTKYVCSML